MNADDVVVATVALWGGELVGRTRLQKGIYLLHRCGADLELSFVYHHYGPYSFELAAGCADAIEERRIEVEERPGRRNGRYWVFKATERCGAVGALTPDRARRIVDRLRPCTDLVLEIAATIVFLRDEGGYAKDEDAIAETRSRKAQKVTDERMEKALALLRGLELMPRAAASRAG